MDRTTKYAESVVNGTIDRAIGHDEYLCCKRHLDDLERQDTPEFPYVWDEKKSLTMIEFAENLTLAEGRPQPFRCKGFQDFMFGSWQGWVKKDTSFRRFKTSYTQMARQNGKSVGNSVPSLYYGNFDGYQYPQIYAVATKEDQARIVLKECNKFINADGELSGTKTKKGFFTIQDYRSRILCNLTHGEIRALGRDTDTIDGFRPYFASVDEYHKHKTNQMYKLLTGGCKDLDEYLISVITTAGFDLNSPCKALYDYCVNVISGAIIDDTQFVFICDPDKDDDIWSETTWQKANPFWTTRRLENISNDAIKARNMGGDELVDFQTKSLNIWVQATDDRYINAEHWAQCGDGTSLEDMRGRECYLGLDLSSGGDLTSGTLEFPLIIDNRKKFYIDSHSFLPKMRLDEHIKSDNAPYLDWVQRGLITLTEGESGGYKLDYKYIIAYYKKLIKDYNLKLLAIGYDPHNADAFLSDLAEFGVDMIEIVQSARFLNDATADFALEVDGHNIIYNKSNTLLTWSMVNAVKVSNSFGEIKLDKTRREKRVDPCDSTICSHKLAFKNAKAVNVEEAMKDYLKMMGWDKPKEGV